MTWSLPFSGAERRGQRLGAHHLHPEEEPDLDLDELDSDLEEPESDLDDLDPGLEEPESDFKDLDESDLEEPEFDSNDLDESDLEDPESDLDDMEEPESDLEPEREVSELEKSERELASSFSPCITKTIKTRVMMICELVDRGSYVGSEEVPLSSRHICHHTCS